MRRRSVVLATLGLALLATLGLRRAASPGTAAQAPEVPIFEVDPLWPKPLPNHWLLGSAVGVAVDSRDHVFVVHLTNSFNTRTEIGAAQDPPSAECCLPAPNVLEFDPEGNLVNHWGGPGQGYSWPVSNHGIAIDRDGNVWIGGTGGTDTHMVRFSRDGRFLMHVGKVTPPEAAAAGGAAGATGDTAARGGGGGGRGARGGGGRRGGAPEAPTLPPNSSSMDSFGGAASISFDPAAREGFVADGSRNRRVAVIDLQSGSVKRFFGAYGQKPEDSATPAAARPRIVIDGRPFEPTAPQFGTPVLCAELSHDGLVYVCDRANNRVQVFRKDGSFLGEKVIAPNTRGMGSVWDVAFSSDPAQRFLYVADGTNMKVHILDRESLRVLTSIGDGGRQPGQFFAVHSVATDSQGNLYTTETLEGKRVQKFVFMGLGPATSQNRGVVWPTRR